MIWSGLIISALGISWVFLFLVVLIFVIGLVGKLNQIFPEKVESSEQGISSAKPQDAEEIAAVLAVLHHRSQQK